MKEVLIIVKGDAAKRRQNRRDEILSQIKVGSLIFSYHYGMGTVSKINKNTINIRLIRSGDELKQVDASYFRMPTQEEAASFSTCTCRSDTGTGGRSGEQEQDGGCTCTVQACRCATIAGMPRSGNIEPDGVNDNSAS